MGKIETIELDGLRTKPSGGRKPVLDAEKDLPSVKAAVAANH